MRPGCSRSVYLTWKLPIHAGIFLYTAAVTAAIVAVAGMQRKCGGGGGLN